jgi:hypothetical protein
MESTIGSAIFMLCAVPIFAILFVTISAALKASIFSQGARVTIAICVALLCIVGLSRMFTVPERGVVAGQNADRGFDLLLLPYTALALAILFLLLLLMFFNVKRGDRPGVLEDGVLRRIASSCPSGRRKQSGESVDRPRKRHADAGQETRPVDHREIRRPSGSDDTLRTWNHIKNSDAGGARHEGRREQTD